MAQKRIHADVTETVVAEWRTGEFSYKQLADRHKISKAKVGQLCKGVEKDMAHAVDARVEYLRALNGQNRRIVDAVDVVAEKKARIKLKIESFAEKAIDKAVNLLDNTEVGSDFKAIVDGVDRLSITTNVNERHAKPTTIQNNTQNNYSQLKDDELRSELKLLRTSNGVISD